ncbi:hypothetical protein Pryu01_03014 [Paraliobacillus ryukyuensis]|uniref:Uncharacterized protein YjcR n=1 Tax=Paraliobacillus ryukyuensis TaxID=200904 RepID=A0A366DS08_9BACI|nr:phage terminase small subunit [Paraliobacillus ryukyuensis]RBO92054.1 uncharacterized protein YjcR [Paraliobacillus ryukyuensis]
MPRKRDPRRDKAFEIWKQSNGEKKLKDIAAELDVADTQVRKWKSQDNWNDKVKGNVTNSKRNVTKRKEQKNRSGNPNPVKKFTKRNSAARKHGLRAKYFSDTQQEIMEDFEGFSISDQLWMQIEIKFSAIIQLQKVMWVEEPTETLSEVSSESVGMEGSSTSYKVAYAYEQYESYIKAQTRAMAEYRNLVKQFNELSYEDDERKLKLEQMQTNIDKTKAEVDKLEKDDKQNSTSITIVDRWSDEDD